MDHIFDHYKKTGYLHHAHVIEGVYDCVTPLLLEAIERYMGIKMQGNPNLVVFAVDVFGIDESRRLAEMQSRAGVSSVRQSANESAESPVRKFFIIGANTLTREAQTALLKTFEEPTAGTHFFLVTPHHGAILPTLKSRVVLAASGKDISTSAKEKMFAETFLDSSLSDRFALIKKLTETKKGESVDREIIRRTLDHVERILYTRMAGKPAHSIFQELYHMKTYLLDRGSSPKMLLEHLAVVAP